MDSHSQGNQENNEQAQARSNQEVSVEATDDQLQPEEIFQQPNPSFDQDQVFANSNMNQNQDF